MADAIACLLSFVGVISGLKRLIEGRPVSSASALGGASFIVAAFAFISLVLAVVPLLLMALGSHPRTPQTTSIYLQHRHTLCWANRLSRLIVMCLLQCYPAVACHFANALAVRTSSLADSPSQALFLNTAQPLLLWAQQALFIVAWRWAAVLQLINWCTALAWSARLPCLLPLQAAYGQPDASRNTHTGLLYEEHAVQTCRGFRYIKALVGSLVGDLSPASVPGAEDMCSGYSAVQLLQVFASILLLLVLPLSVIYYLELLLKRGFLKMNGVLYIGPFALASRISSGAVDVIDRARADSIDGSGVGSGGASSSSSGSSRSGGPAATPIGNTSNSGSSNIDSSGGVTDPCIHGSVLGCLVGCASAPVAVLFVAWSLAELVVWWLRNVHCIGMGVPVASGPHSTPPSICTGAV